MTTTAALDVRALSDDALAALYGSNDETARAAALAEAERRDQAARSKSARDAERAEWELGAHAGYLAAVDATNGYLLSPAGIAAGIDERSLWTGPADRAYRYASEELLEHWRQAGRTTVTDYRAGLAADRRAERAAVTALPEVTTATVPTYAEVEPQDTLLLSEQPYLPYGEVVIIYGDGSIGKGRAVHSIVAAVTNGQPAGRDAATEDEAGDVVMILPEDKQREQAVKRLIASGADRARVHDLTRLPDGQRFKLSAKVGVPGHLPLLEAFIEDLRELGKNPRLAVIDPLASVIGQGSIQTNAGARALIEPLQDMAERTGVCVILVAHPVTGGKLQGSVALQQAARIVYHVTRDGEHRVMSIEKGNDIPPRLAGDLRFGITDGEAGPRVVWLDQAEIGQSKQDWRDELAARRKARTMAAPAPATPGTENVRAALEQAQARHALRRLARAAGSRS